MSQLIVAIIEKTDFSTVSLNFALPGPTPSTLRDTAVLAAYVRPTGVRTAEPTSQDFNGWAKAHGVQTGINYPVALPFLPAYMHLGHKPADFPSAHHNQSRILSLPMYAEMSAVQVGHVVAAIKSFAAATG
jgi:dTDP-4-amino-4,6-dideoxygalactose transaminase